MYVKIMPKNFIKITFMTTLFAFVFLVGAGVAHAVDLKSQVGAQLGAGLEKSGLGSAKDPRVVAATVVQFFLGLLATIFLIMIAMSSFWYITAHGEEQKIAKATATIRGAVIGLVIVMMAYSITYFVSKRVQKAAGVPTSGIIELIVPTVYAQSTVGSSMNRFTSAFAGEQGAGFSTPSDPRAVVGRVIEIFLSILGILFVAYAVYAGYLIMSSGGEEEKIRKGKSTLQTAAIGVFVIFSAYSILYFVVGSVWFATEARPTGSYIEAGISTKPYNYCPDGVINQFGDCIKR